MLQTSGNVLLGRGAKDEIISLGWLECVVLDELEEFAEERDRVEGRDSLVKLLSGSEIQIKVGKDVEYVNHFAMSIT